MGASMIAYGCGRHALSGTPEEMRRQYAAVAKIRDRMEREGRFDAIRAQPRFDKRHGREDYQLGLSAYWEDCMDIVWNEF